METALILLTAQGVLGALDNAVHHEWHQRLAWRPSARRERALHAVLTFHFGVAAGLLLPDCQAWAALPTALVWAPKGPFAWIFALYGLGCLLWAAREAIASIGLRSKES